MTTRATRAGSMVRKLDRFEEAERASTDAGHAEGRIEGQGA